MDERIPPFRTGIKKKRSSSPIIFVFVLLFFMGILLVLFLKSPLSQIESIDIQGNKLVSESELRQVIQVNVGDSYFFVDEDQIESALEQRNVVHEAEVKKSFPHELKIRITEKPVIGVYLDKDQQFLLFSDGTRMSNYKKIQEMDEHTIFEGWKSKDPLLKQVVTEWVKLPSEIKNQVLRVKPRTNQEDQVEIKTKKNHTIYVRANDLSHKMRLYPSFYEHDEGTVNLLESIWFTPAE
ncbi:FtsQ-type POTRA domain-containing protein [Hazenella sp. IB182357]|uniref:FtsQ-type POTRA domain-containing protein n=1 Tax=Polycladospora coralii TaxID=2771432 RepID=A0A926RSJ5_9BACL|nr:FtsQ-type POTRA domain-containing protein [Polycladospora coralii]